MGTYVVDAVALMTKLIDDNWDEEAEVSKPFIYYMTNTELTGDTQERGLLSHDYYSGSAIFLSQGPMPMGYASIDSNAINKETTVYLTLRGLARDMVYAQADEIVKTLMRTRRNVTGFDYLEFKNITIVQEQYVNFYRMNMDIQLKRVTQSIEEDGFA